MSMDLLAYGMDSPVVGNMSKRATIYGKEPGGGKEGQGGEGSKVH